MSSRQTLRALCCILVSGFASEAYAQQTVPGAIPAPAYKPFRYDEDYSYLQDPTRRTDIWDPIKYIPLGSPDWYLSLGGELRERFEYYSHPNFGLQGQGPNGYLLHRALLHADLHAGENFRAFLQFGNYLAPGKDQAEPPYLDELDVQQAFADIRLPLAPSGDLDPTLRVGRQEMAFGSQRLVAIRDAPNVRRNFDGIRLGDTIGGVRIDAFLTRPVLQRKGVFDDRWNLSEAFWGVYSTTPVSLVPGASLDLYYLGFENEHADYAAGVGNEERHTVGSRFFGTAAGWDWDWEALGQFGSFAQVDVDQDILAWGFSTDTGYTVELADWKVRFGLKADIGSGDHNLNNTTLGTLNPLFPKLAYFNQAALLGPSNVMDLQPSVSFMPTERLKLTVGYDFLWRNSTADAIYTGAGVPIAGTAGRPGKFTGSQLSVDLSWQLDRHVLFEAGYVHFDAGSALSQAGGQDVNFAYAAATYKF